MDNLLSENCKSKCQIFTPEKNVEELLEWCNYKYNLYGKKVLEPTFGKGNILIKIVQKYIEDCLINQMTIEEIKKGLEKDIYGVEYDKKYYNMCIKNLNDMVKKYGIDDVNWNLYNCDFLKKKFNFKFDYIIGNPPYISYKMLDEITREYVRTSFSICAEGKFDYCYAFIEKGIEILNEKGILIYLIPGSIFKNVFSKKLREFILEDLVAIHDYGTRKLFNEEASGKKRNILTSSAVIVVEKKSSKENFSYFNEETENKTIISKKNLSNNKWIFKKEFIKKNKRFGDYFKAANSIATLCNKAFILTEEDNLYKEKNKIILKAISPKNMQTKKIEKIIFPYYYKKGELCRFEKNEFEEKFPDVCNHLKKYNSELNQRNSDENINWYEYGRSQALKDMNKQKLLLSIIVTNKVKVYKLNKNEIPYSGIYIIPKSNLTLEQAKEILESSEFYEYIMDVGINVSGESYRITSKDISNYYF